LLVLSVCTGISGCTCTHLYCPSLLVRIAQTGPPTRRELDDLRLKVAALATTVSSSLSLGQGLQPQLSESGEWELKLSLGYLQRQAHSGDMSSSLSLGQLQPQLSESGE
jgi:hypothetical protein